MLKNFTDPATEKVAGGYELLKRAWVIYKTNWKKFALIMLVGFLAVVPLVVIFLLITLLSNLGNNGYLGEGASAIIGIILSLLGMAGVLFVIYMFLWIVVALLSAVKNLELGQEVIIKQIFKENRNKVGGYLWITFLSGSIVLLGYILLIVPGIIWSVMFSLAFYILIGEDVRGWAALKRSRELVRGFWWTIFARLLVIGVLIVFLNLILSLPAIIIGSIASTLDYKIIIDIVGQINVVVINFIVIPLSLAASYLLYLELKKIKDKSPESKDGLSVGKKLSLSLIIVIPAILIILVGYSVFKLAKSDFYSENNFSSTLDMNETVNIYEELEELSDTSSTVRDMQRETSLMIIQTDLDVYYDEYNEYPATILELNNYLEQSLINKGVVDAESISKALKDPLTLDYYSYNVLDDGFSYELCMDFELGIEGQSIRKGVNCFVP